MPEGNRQTEHLLMHMGFSVFLLLRRTAARYAAHSPLPPARFFPLYSETLPRNNTPLL